MDAVIELDPSTPWKLPLEPSPPPQRVRVRRRWIAFGVVMLFVAGMLVAAVPRVSTDPVYTVDDFRVLSVQAGGGRLIVERFQPVGAGTQVDVLRLRDGARLWSMTLDVGQHLTFLTDHVMALVSDVVSGSAGALIVLDAATGEQLWQRAQVAYFGQFGGRVLVEDVAGVVEENPVVEVGENPVNVVPEQRGRRYLALDERTGAVVWDLRVPEGSVADFSWVGGSTGPAFMAELSPAGLLRVRDLGTGGVVSEDQLEWSGTISSFATGGSLPWSGAAEPARVLIARAGEPGTDVYDRATGRLLWRWQGERSSGGGADLYPCATDLYCLRDDSGFTAVDPRTGERLWHADGYDGVLGGDGDILVVSPRPAGDAAPPFVALDARTGRVVAGLVGWHLVEGVPGRGLVMWKPGNDRTAVLGVLDPRSSRVTVFGRSATWYRYAECHQDRDMLACLVDGALSVWTLP